MSGTTVRSENNQCKTQVTGMEIRFNTRENKYEIETGKALNEVLKDHIQEQGEIGINVGSGYVEKNGKDTQLVTTNGTKAMKNSRAYEIISKQREQRKERNGKIKALEK